jgi:hypothetical protein
MTFGTRKLAPLLGLLPMLALADFDSAHWKTRLAQQEDINSLGMLYLELSVEEYPTQGVSYGLHGKDGDSRYYDKRLPDPSKEAGARFLAARQALLAKLETIDSEVLSRDDQVDLHILKTRAKLDLLSSIDLKDRESPYNWSSALSSGMSGLIMRDYAPLDGRLQSFGSRCEKTGEYLDKVRAALAPADIEPTAQHKSTALAQFKGLDQDGGLYDKNLPELLAKSTLAKAQQ